VPWPAGVASFDDAAPPPGESPYLSGYGPSALVSVVEYDTSWPDTYGRLAELIRSALGSAVLALDHVGSTAVPRLAAKPVIDVDLTVPEVAAEASFPPRRGRQRAVVDKSLSLRLFFNQLVAKPIG
jgi:GrpB-like predicted nucleotidyltransferase (UPF0157 family)